MSALPPLNNTTDDKPRKMTKARSMSVVQPDERALLKLGVTEETIRIEKLMKKLGVCDNDLHEYSELQRHSAVLAVSTENLTKEELLSGYSKKQMQRAKAVKSLGTTEEEILDDHAQKVSELGAQLCPPKTAQPRSLSPRRMSMIFTGPAKWTGGGVG